MTEFLTILIAGLSSGAIYAMSALGFTLAFNSSGILNMLQGVFVVLGGLISYEGIVNWHLGTPLAVLLAVVVVTAMAALFQVVVLQPNQHRLPPETLLLIVLGGLILAQGAATIVWGVFSYTLPPFGNLYNFKLGDQRIPAQVVWIVLVATLVCVALALTLAKTNIGRALRALAENVGGAQVIGLRVRLMSLGAFAATGTLGALAGALVTPYLSISTSNAANFTVIGIIAISLGGFGSYFGAVIGGLVLGVIEALATGYLSSLYGQSLLLLALIIILVVRPDGLLRVASRVRSDVSAVVGTKVHYVHRAPKIVGRPVLLALAVFMTVLPYLGLGVQLYYLNIVGITGLVLIGMDVLMGYLGMVSLGQSAFMAVGGYVTALSCIHWKLSPLEGLMLGIIASVAVAYVFSLITRRLAPHYLAIVSLAFALLVANLAGELSFTGGSAGLVGIPSFSIGGLVFDADYKYYYLIWGLLGVFGFGTMFVLRGRVGRVMKAATFDPGAAAALGADVRRYRHWALLYSAALAGLAGGLYAMYLQFLAPSQVGLALSFTLIVSTVFGGAGTILGPIIGGAIFTYLPLVSQGFEQWSTVAQGALVIVVLSVAPGGVLGSGLNLLARVMGRRGSDPPPPAVQAGARASSPPRLTTKGVRGVSV